MAIDLRRIARPRRGGAKPEPLALGSLAATPSLHGIVLRLSAPLSGGSGTGYEYAIHRGTRADFAIDRSSLIAQTATLPYVDRATEAGTLYFYTLIGSDDAHATVTALPAGTHLWPAESIPSVAATARPRALNIVFAGDSITYGLGVRHAGTVKLPTMPGYCITALRRRLGLGEIYGSNQGHNSHTLTDYAPGGGDYRQAFDRDNPKSGASRLRALHPEAQMVISLMLGTNDSALSGSNNAPFQGCLPPDAYRDKLATIVDQILKVDAPDAMIVLHAPPYYTANSRTNFTYGPEGLQAMMGYAGAIGELAASYAKTYPGRVHQGDTSAFEYFAQTYRTEHQPQRFRGSVFYLHPSGVPGANGLIGTQSLGELHAEAIVRGLG